MKKGVFWFGLSGLIAGILFLFLSGSSSGPNLEPTVPFIYGTNQGYWMFLGLVGFIVMIIGLIIRSKKSKR